MNKQICIAVIIFVAFVSIANADECNEYSCNIKSNSEDNTTIINDTIRSMHHGGKIVLYPGTYRINSTIELNDSITLSCLFKYGCKIEYSGNEDAIRTYRHNAPYVDGYDNILIENIVVNDTLGTGRNGLNLSGFRLSSAKNIMVTGFDYGLKTKHSWYSTFEGLYISGFRKYGIYSSSNDNNDKYSQIKISNGADGSVLSGSMRVISASNIILENIDIESNTSGMHLDETSAAVVMGYYYEPTNKAANKAVYGMLLDETKGTVIISPYIYGANRLNRGIHLISDTNTTIIGGSIANTTNYTFYNGGNSYTTVINTYFDKILPLYISGFVKLL